MDRSPLNAAEFARPSGNFGRLAFGFLAVSFATGMALVPLYDPAAPLLSLERIEGGLPWGAFLRGLHVWSSFALLGATLAHAAEVVIKKTEKQLSPGVWWRSVTLLPLLILALLGGFVLRGDAEARAAADIWRSLASSVPVLGKEITIFLTGAEKGALSAVALHHAGTISILLLVFTIEHGRLFWPGARAATLAGLVSMTAAGLFVVPLGPPPPGHGLLLGPWSLLGLQGLLVELHPAVGWVFPLLGVVILGAIRHLTGKGRTLLIVPLVLGVLIYLGFTVRILVLART